MKIEEMIERNFEADKNGRILDDYGNEYRNENGEIERLEKTKVYVVIFHYDKDHDVEGVFFDKQSAKNYIFNQSLERGLYIPDDIEYKEYGINIQKKVSESDVDELLEGWGCDTEDHKKEFLDRLKHDLEKTSRGE